MCLLHTDNFSLAFVADFFMDRCTIGGSPLVSVLDSAIVSSSSVDISSGYNLDIGQFVLPVFVLIFAALTYPSLPLISLWITAIFQLVLGESS